jgi:hypothetical protein
MRRFFEVATTILLLVGIVVAGILIYGGLQAFQYVIFIIIPILLVTTLASYFTILLCRFARLRRWRVHWHFGLVGAMASGILAIFVVWLGLSLQAGGYGMFDLRPMLYSMCIVGSTLGVLPAEIIVWHYRKRFRDENHVA